MCPSGSIQATSRYVFDVVVAHQVVRDTLEADANGLLDETLFLEVVRVDQGTNKSPLGIVASSAVMI